MVEVAAVHIPHTLALSSAGNSHRSNAMNIRRWWYQRTTNERWFYSFAVAVAVVVVLTVVSA